MARSGGRGMSGRLDMDQDDGARLYDHSVVTRLFKYMLPYWPRLLFTVAAIIVYTGSVVAIPWMVALIIDRYVRVGDLAGLNVIVPVFPGPRPAPVWRPLSPPEDNGIRRTGGPIHPPSPPLPSPAAPLHELLQQERGRQGDVQGSERCAAAPGVSDNRHDHHCRRSKPGRNHNRDGDHERAIGRDNSAGHPAALRNSRDLAEVSRAAHS